MGINQCGRGELTQLDWMELLHLRRRLPSLLTHRQLQVHHQSTRIRTPNLVRINLTRPNRLRTEPVPGTKQHTRPRIQHHNPSRHLSPRSIPIHTQTQTRVEAEPGRESARRPLLFLSSFLSTNTTESGARLLGKGQCSDFVYGPSVPQRMQNNRLPMNLIDDSILSDPERKQTFQFSVQRFSATWLFFQG